MSVIADMQEYMDRVRGYFERAMLNRLERRGLVDAHYTSRRRARAFTISDRGRVVTGSNHE